MRYASGEEARLGDEVRLGNSESGFVVCSLDTDEYSEDYRAEDREYLGEGILVHFDRLGLIHYVTTEPALRLIARAGSI